MTGEDQLDALSLAAVQDATALQVLLDALEENGQPCPQYVRRLDEVFFPTSRDYRKRVEEYRTEHALAVARERAERLFKTHWSTRPWRGLPKGVLCLEPRGGGPYLAGWPRIDLGAGERLELRVLSRFPIDPQRVSSSDAENAHYIVLAISSVRVNQDEVASEMPTVMTVLIENVTDKPVTLRTLTLRYAVTNDQRSVVW